MLLAGENNIGSHNSDSDKITKQKRKRSIVKSAKRLTETKKRGRPVKVRTVEEKVRIRINYNCGVCTVCGKYSKSMYQHMQGHIKVDEIVECDYCHRKLSGKRNLTKHFKYHFKERFV